MLTNPFSPCFVKAADNINTCNSTNLVEDLRKHSDLNSKAFFWKPDPISCRKLKVNWAVPEMNIHRDLLDNLELY